MLALTFAEFLILIDKISLGGGTGTPLAIGFPVTIRLGFRQGCGPPFLSHPAGTLGLDGDAPRAVDYTVS